MTRTADRWMRSWVVLGMLAAAGFAWAGGIADFQLARAIPADAMLVVHYRDHAGLSFLNTQFERVWEAVQKQGFDRDLKRFIKGLIQDQGGDAAAFDEQWQKVADPAATVQWSTLADREFAFALKVTFPTGGEFLLLLMPPADRVDKDFAGLTATLKAILSFVPEGQLQLTSEGEGESVLHRVSIPGSPVPFALTLARHKDVVLFGIGSVLVEQSLALLRGDSDAGTATLASTERFRQAFQRLPAPTDELAFVDLAKIMAQSRQFATMVQAMAAPPTTEPAEAGPSPVGFLVPLVDSFDLWETIASVATTDGLKTTGETAAVLREDAKSRPLHKAFYGNAPVSSPLKYVPKEATGVGVGSGVDFRALYRAIVEFVEKHVPQGQELLAQWAETQKKIELDVEKDVLSWLGGGYVSFTAPGATAYTQEWVLVLGVRDEPKANELLNRAYAKLNEALAQQNGGVEDAQLEQAPGFKRIILPAFFAMLPGLGRPVVGVKDGHLFLGNSPELVVKALQTGAGQHEDFTKNERFQKEGLPLGADVTEFAFQDLSKLGEELSQMFAMVGVVQMMMPPEATKNPAVLTVLSVLNKVGRVVRTLDFYRSTCSVTTFDGKVNLTRKITNYQEPPKPAAEPTPPAETEAKPAATPAEEPAKPNGR